LSLSTPERTLIDMTERLDVSPTRPTLERADRVGQFAPLRGLDLVLVNEQGSHRDYRAWSDLLVEDDGAWVEVVRERHWWVWSITGVQPRVIRWPAGAAWVIEWAGSPAPVPPPM
jgi:hypothetical protein